MPTRDRTSGRVHADRVAILLAAYNGMRWLPEQLSSILGQDGVDVTVFASADRSDDGTEAWLKERAKQEPRLIVLTPGRFGGAAANFFRLIREVEFDGFDYVGLADQDDLWMPDKLKRAISRLTAARASAYSANVIAFWEDGRTELIDKSQPQQALDFVFEAAGPGCTYVFDPALAAALKTFVRNNAGAMQQVQLHDWFIYAFARAKGFHWVIDARPCMRYRQHAANQVGVNQGLDALLRRARMAVDGRAFDQAALIARLVGADSHPAVATWLARGRRGLLGLSLHARRCRRRPRDQALFFVACWLRALNPFGAPSRSAGA